MQIKNHDTNSQSRNTFWLNYFILCWNLNILSFVFNVVVVCCCCCVHKMFFFVMENTLIRRYWNYTVICKNSMLIQTIWHRTHLNMYTNLRCIHALTQHGRLAAVNGNNKIKTTNRREIIIKKMNKKKTTSTKQTNKPRRRREANENNSERKNNERAPSCTHNKRRKKRLCHETIAYTTDCYGRKVEQIFLLYTRWWVLLLLLLLCIYTDTHTHIHTLPWNVCIGGG